jgi:hypothetical protein
MMDEGVSAEGVRRVMALQSKIERLEAALAGAEARLKSRPGHDGEPPGRGQEDGRRGGPVTRAATLVEHLST